MTEPYLTNFSLSEKFQSVYELFAGFNQDLENLHNSLTIHDDATRAVFGSLSRLAAYSDQVQLIFSLMREDIRVIDELTADPVTAAFTGQFEPRFYDWLRTSHAAAPKIH